MTMGDRQTYYHGSRARLRPGALTRPGHRPNPWGDAFDDRDRGRSVYVYAAVELTTAQAYADAIRRLGCRAYVYEVEPTGPVSGPANDIRSREPFLVLRCIEDNAVDPRG